MKERILVELDVVECFDIREEVIDEKTGERAIITKMKWQQAGTININKRRYRNELFEKEITRLLPLCKEGRVFGGGYHPEGVKDVEVNNAAILWLNLWMEEDGSCIGEAKIMPTRIGKDAMVIIKSGGRIGLSSRGFGTVTQKTEKIGDETVTFFDVNDGFKLKSPGDIVLSPSVADSGIQERIEERWNEIYNKSLPSKASDLQNKIQGEEMNLEELKTKNPELVKQIEDAKEAELKKANESNKEEWKKEVEKQVDEKVKPLQTKVDTLEAERTTTIESIRGATEAFAKGAAALSEIPGVIPEEDKDNPQDEPKADNSELAKKVAALEKDNTELKKKVEDSEKATDDAKKATELQGKLKKTLETELKKEENEDYRSLIEKKLIVDGQINIESEEAVEDAVAEAKKDINDTLAKAKAAKIIKADLNEVGEVENPEGEKDAQKETVLRRQFTEAINGGYTGNYTDWLKLQEEKV